MSEPKEDIDLLSQKELEDGEIEDGELNEPELVNTVDNESELISNEIHDDSDVDLNDKSVLKTKKHKHHKKGLHRKRHINSEEKGDNMWKKSKKSCDEDDDEESSPEIIGSKLTNDDESYLVENPFKDNKVDNNFGGSAKAVEKWGDYESDDDKCPPKISKPDIKQLSYNEPFDKSRNSRMLSPEYEATKVDDDDCVMTEPIETSKWNDYNSDEETATSSTFSKTDNSRKQFDEPQYNNSKPVKRWDSNYNKRNDNTGWDDNRQDSVPKSSDNFNKSSSPVKNFDMHEKSPVVEKSAWGSYSSPSCNDEDTNKKSEAPNSPVKSNSDNFGKWGDYDSPDKTTESSNKGGFSDSPKRNEDSNKWGNRDDNSNKWGNRDDNSNKWGNRDDNSNKWGNRDDNSNKWGSRDDNSNKWGSSDSPKRNDDSNKWGSRDDNSNKWGSRDEGDDNNNQRWGFRDGSRRSNFRRGGGRDGARRNNRRGGGRDGGQRNYDNNQRWGSSNNGSPQRNDGDNKRWGSSNNASPSRANNNKGWGSSNNGSPSRSNDNKKWGSNNGSPSRINTNKGWGSSNNGSPSRSNDNKKWGSNNGSPSRSNTNKGWGSNNGSPTRSNDNKKLGSNNASPSRNNDSNKGWASPGGSPKNDNEVDKQDSIDHPCVATKWGYDSDEDTNTPAIVNKTSNFESKENLGPTENKWASYDSPEKNNDTFNKFASQASPQETKNAGGSSPGFSKWGDFDSDDETKPTAKESAPSNTNTYKSEKPGWKSFGSDDESKGTSNDNNYENRNKGGYNNSSWNRNDRNDRNDFRNDRGGDRGDRNKNWSNRNDNEKRNVCRYFSMGSCRHGDRCTFLHESPNKSSMNAPQETKKKELCKFYEHQQCYRRANCTSMHEEFPCKLFHAGSKMCPSGDSCKYSHAPLNQETKALLEKYLDEKVDERTEKKASDWSSVIRKSNEDDMDDDSALGFEQPEGFFPDPMRYRYPGGQDMMRFPVRPWSSMMQVPHQMEFMHRQRMMYDRFQYPISGRLFPRSFRGMVPPNMMEGFSNGMPYSIPPLMPGNPKIHPGTPVDNISDPYIDNLAQLVVGKDPVGSPKRLVDMLDPNMQCEDIDDFSLEIETNNSSKKNLSSPVVIKSPEIPPGAYVPRTSMNVAQPNVRLGPGPAYGGEQAMLYGGYPAHPGESAMMDYINMSAFHYFPNHNEALGYDVPWKLLLLEVPIKIPYPLMVIETQELPHKYTDPRLRGHPTVLNSNSTNEESILHQNSYDFNSISTFGSQLQSPNFVTTSSETSESLTPLNDFLPKSDEPDSPMFPVGEDIFNFKNKLETDDYSKRVSDRSYLQDPRFKRKKASVNTSMELSEMD